MALSLNLTVAIYNFEVHIRLLVVLDDRACLGACSVSFIRSLPLFEGNIN